MSGVRVPQRPQVSFPNLRRCSGCNCFECTKAGYRVKVTKFTLRGDEVLGDYVLDLSTLPGNSVHYLVGINGAGKSRLLELLHSSITRAANESASVGCKLVVELEGEGTVLRAPYDRISPSTWCTEPIQIVSGVGSEQPGTFDTTVPVCCLLVSADGLLDIRQVTASTALMPGETKNLKKRSKDLHADIPQLLVNIQTADNNELRRSFDAQGGQIAQGTSLDLRIDRFKDAFHYMMGGAKSFKEVRSEEGKIRIIFVDRNGNETDLASLSSGEKQAVFRLSFILANSNPGNPTVLLVDEPELSLHPDWQVRYVESLKQLFQAGKLQLILASHSPFIFEKFDPSTEECIRIDRTATASEQVILQLAGSNQPPSAPLVAFKAFGIWTEALSIELFERLLAKFGVSSPSRLNDKLQEAPTSLTALNRSKSGATNFGRFGTCQETLPVWVRNHLHHPDQQDRQVPTLAEKKQAVSEMLTILC
jgi:ABC-type molybdenum transport system ATPase subunit/photorepair protein PhrA